MARTEGIRTEQVWDPLVRIIHWSLVVLFTFAYLTGDELEEPHEIAGYIIAALVVFRIVWRLIGSRHARFSDFIYSPSKVFAFLRDSLKFRAPRYLGHNPAGGAMVIALLVAISLICATGIMMEFDTWARSEWVEEVHEVAANATLFLIALHIAGVILASMEHRENLARSMVTGRKRAE